MRPIETVAERPLDLAGRLRIATADAHRRLEAELDLLRPPLGRARFTGLLERFYGFHLVWEGAVAAVAGLGVLMRQRSRLERLRADLAALGITPGRIAAAPRCTAAAGLGRSLPAALGSLYVMEGSTLGGQVIGRALQGASWLPPRGLTYFDPYGPRTGAMWRAFRTAADLICPAGEEPAVEAGAAETFELLRTWLAGRAAA